MVEESQFNSQQGQEILTTYLPPHPPNHLAVTEVCVIIFITYVVIFPCLFA